MRALILTWRCDILTNHNIEEYIYFLLKYLEEMSWWVFNIGYVVAVYQKEFIIDNQDYLFNCIPQIQPTYSTVMFIYWSIQQQCRPVMYLHSSSFPHSPSLCLLNPRLSVCCRERSFSQQGQYEQFSATALDSVMEICASILFIVCGLRVSQPSPPFESGAWDWYVQILEGSLEWWEGRTHTNKVVFCAF